MEFLNPTLLMGMAAASVPVLIHLIQRKRAPQHPFPPVRLLQDARQRISRRIRLRHVLVMLLRALFIALLAAAFARPFIKQVKSLTLSEEPTACVIVLDDSLSMRYRPRGAESTLFDDAKERARKVLEKLRDFDRSALVMLSGVEAGTATPGGEHAKTLRALSELEPRYGAYDAGEAIAQARKLLRESQLKEKKLVVLSDQTRSSWSRSDFDLLTAAEAEVSMPALVEVDESRGNRFFKKVEVSTTGNGIGVNVDVRSLGAFPDPEYDVKLFVGGDLRDQESFAGRAVEGKTQLRTEIARRQYTGRIELSQDPLKADNVYHLAGRAKKAVRVLLVEGDPHETLYRNETYHMNLALSGRDEGTKAEVITPVRLGKTNLAQFDCVVLANLRPEDLPAPERLRSFLKNGGNLWYVLGEHGRGEPAAKRSLQKYLPVLLENVQKRTEGREAQVRTQTLTHPIFQAFPARWIRQFGRARFRQWWLMKPRAEADVIMQLENGQPLLVGAKRHGGQVFVAASPLAREWNDFSLQPVFVPFMQRAVRYVAGRLASAQDQTLLVGETYRLELPGNPTHLYVHPPKSTSPQRVEVMEGQEGTIMRYGDTDRPGVYTVSRDAEGRDVVSRFVVNVSPRASNIRGWDEKAAETRRLTSQSFRADKGGTRTGENRIWRMLLWAALLTLCAESVLARW